MSFALNIFAAPIEKTITTVYDDIKIFLNGKHIELKDVNGKEVEPFTYEGTTYVPLRALMEKIGKKVTWDDNSNIIIIDDNGPTVKLYDFNLRYWVGGGLPMPNGIFSLSTTIDGTGKYTSTRYDGTVNLKHLSDEQMDELIEYIIKNNFFDFPENIDGSRNVADIMSQSLTISYNGKEHKCGGYNVENNSFLNICSFINELSAN